MLTAAHRCLLQRGYAATTVRDLVAESGANLASINYHFGSKERLLNQALFELNSQWGEVIFAALDGAGGSTAQRWQQVIDSITERRDLWFVNFEALVLAQHDEEIRSGLAERGDGARVALARSFAGVTAENSSAADVHRVGSFYYSQLIGVAFQWLTDPETAPSAEEVAGGPNLG
nr:TetR/AcrR family transcriptional regulator [Nakamurella aerolata]